MVTVGMHYDVLPGKQEAFEDEMRQVGAALAGVSGHVQTRLYRDVERPSTYLIYSEWADREAYGAFIRSEAFAAVIKRGAAGLLAGPPRHHVLTAELSG